MIKVITKEKNFSLSFKYKEASIYMYKRHVAILEQCICLIKAGVREVSIDTSSVLLKRVDVKIINWRNQGDYTIDELEEILIIAKKLFLAIGDEVHFKYNHKEYKGIVSDILQNMCSIKVDSSFIWIDKSELDFSLSHLKTSFNIGDKVLVKSEECKLSTKYVTGKIVLCSPYCCLVNFGIDKPIKWISKSNLLFT